MSDDLLDRLKRGEHPHSVVIVDDDGTITDVHGPFETRSAADLWRAERLCKQARVKIVPNWKPRAKGEVLRMIESMKSVHAPPLRDWERN